MKIIKQFPPLGSERFFCRDYGNQWWFLIVYRFFSSVPATSKVHINFYRVSYFWALVFFPFLCMDMAWAEELNLSVIRINSLLISLICINKIIFIISTIIKKFLPRFLTAWRVFPFRRTFSSGEKKILN